MVVVIEIEELVFISREKGSLGITSLDRPPVCGIPRVFYIGAVAYLRVAKGCKRRFERDREPKRSLRTANTLAIMYRAFFILCGVIDYKYIGGRYFGEKAKVRQIRRLVDRYSHNLGQ